MVKKNGDNIVDMLKELQSASGAGNDADYGDLMKNIGSMMENAMSVLEKTGVPGESKDDNKPSLPSNATYDLNKTSSLYSNPNTSPMEGKKDNITGSSGGNSPAVSIDLDDSGKLVNSKFDAKEIFESCSDNGSTDWDAVSDMLSSLLSVAYNDAFSKLGEQDGSELTGQVGDMLDQLGGMSGLKNVLDMVKSGSLK